MRLANVKTRTESGFEYVVNSIEIGTPFGKKQIKEMKPFFPGEEELLKKELSRIDEMLAFAEAEEKNVQIINNEIFMCMKDNTFTVERSGGTVLSDVELFEIKALLMQMEQLDGIFEKSSVKVPEEYRLENTGRLLDCLDPRHDRMASFYICDEFSSKLKEIREKKRELEISVRREQKKQKEIIKEKYGIILTPKFDIAVSKSSDSIKMIREIEDLEPVEEDYVSVTFQLKKTEEVYNLVKEMEKLKDQIEICEEEIRSRLSKEIWKCSEVILENCRRIGVFDFALAKAMYAKKHRCVRPEITDEHMIHIEEGRNVRVEDILLSKGKGYMPVSISLGDGVTCITGANMGGKTVSLKLVGLVALLTQYGFFVPAGYAKIGLSNYMQMLIGDSQSVERGLSSFGSEMEELKEILDNSRDRSVILIDEIASGTNPVEGLALTKSLVDYLMERPYISLITTHFETVTDIKGVRNMQVRGLQDADFTRLDKELRYANRKERISIIQRYMDYRLYEAKGKEVPKDALNIAKMLGIGPEILDRAKLYIQNN